MEKKDKNKLYKDLWKKDERQSQEWLKIAWPERHCLTMFVI